MSKDDSVFGALASVVGAIVLLPVALVLMSAPLLAVKGYVLMKLWGWFVVPLGVPAIGYWLAIGIGIVVGFAVRGATSGGGKKMGEEGFWMDYVAGLISPWAVLGIGWLVHAMAA